MASQNSLSSLLANNLIKAYTGSNWTHVSILETIKSLNYSQAQQLTNASPNTIASILNHLKYWNGIISARLDGQYSTVPDSNGFDVAILESEEDWQRLIAETQTSFEHLAAEISNITTDKWDNRPAPHSGTMREQVFGIVEHAYYHLGQIVIISHLVK